MLTQQTVTHLRSLRLDGMARAFEEQLTQPVATGLAFEDRFGLLVDRELAWRDTRRLERLLKQAKLKYPDACIEDLDTRSARALDPRQLASLAGADWIRAGHSVLITGATLDRIVHGSHRLVLKGESLRKKTTEKGSRKS